MGDATGPGPGKVMPTTFIPTPVRATARDDSAPSGPTADHDRDRDHDHDHDHDTVIGAPPIAAQSPPRYELGHEIARGGMGRVVEANDTLLHRIVAYKEALASDADALRRFARETRITARLEHPAIVPVHDAGVSPTGEPFYVMRKISGRPLESLVAEADTLGQRLALLPHIVASAHAIAHAHERGIVHRDIKPSNILVGDLGETIVIDWGLAKVLAERDDDDIPIGALPAQLAADTASPLHTRAGVVFGTPGFMSPEQLQGAPVDEQVDVYALGATLYHLLARRPPHYAATAQEMMQAAVDAAPSPLSQFVAGVPPELETIVAKALAHTAQQRYRNARALADDLQAFLTGQLVAAHHYSKREQLVRFVRKHKVEVGVAIAAIVAIVAIGSVAFVRVVAARDRADAAALEADAKRREAEAANTKLRLDHARALIATDPTAAVGILTANLGDGDDVAHLDDGDWRQVRAIAAGARAAGVAYSLPASPRTRSLELAGDGTHLLAVGEDGVIRLADLAARSERTVAEFKQPVLAHLTADGAHIAVAAGRRLTVLDVATGAHRDVDVAAPIETLAVGAATAFWLDADHNGYALDTASPSAAPVQIAAAEPLLALSPSPDGKWIVAVGTHIFVGDRSDPEAEMQAPAELTDTQQAGAKKSLQITWSPDSELVAVLVGDDVLELEVSATSGIAHRYLVGDQRAMVITGADTYVANDTNVRAANRGGAIHLIDLPGRLLGLELGRSARPVAGVARGALFAVGETGLTKLVASDAFTAFATAPGSKFAVAAGRGRLWVWSFDDTTPRRFATGGGTSIGFASSQVVLGTGRDGAVWFDLQSGKLTSASAMTAFISLAIAPDGKLVAARDAAHRLHAIPANASELADHPDEDVADAQFLADGTLALAIGNAVHVRDLAHGAPGKDAVVATRPAALTRIAAAGTWIAALAADGSLARIAAATGRAAAITAGVTDAPLAIAADGTIYFAAAGELRGWLPDNSVVVIAKLPRAVTELALVDGDRAVARGDAELYAIDLRARALVRTIDAAGIGAVCARDGVSVIETGAGILEVFDPFASGADGMRWTMAAGGDAFTTVALAPACDRVLAKNQNGVYLWPLALPQTAAATATWLDGMTRVSK